MKESYSDLDARGRARALLDAGFAVASVNYRYSTEAIWPAQLDDLRDAFKFLRTRASDFGIDGTRVASYNPFVSLYLPAVRFLRARGMPVTAWTITTPPAATAALRGADQIVFEGFLPASA